MKLIVGLGNPGDKYADSRHNIGFSAIKSLAKAYKISLKKDFFISSISGKGRIHGEFVALAMPLTFMNLSGNAVKPLLKKYKADISDLLIICDDMDLDIGRIKARPSGTSGGQRGMESIIKSLSTDEFARLRIGIGRPPRQIDPSDYVLSRFQAKEKELISEALEQASQCCLVWVTKGITEAMNNFNKRSKQNE
ncbi:MAG: aminoacyl-tRNA hydrolase [Candidatus Omnitrophica bacterium]|nr:aminoacyl-tRNA hydrolase [Candidatus Omnitrophota bacterium]